MAGWMIKLAATTVAAGLAVVGLPVAYRWAMSHDRVATVTSVPAAPVALVLGAEVYSNGTPSPYLRARLDLAAKLYKAGKVKVLLVSGDNGTKQYNETDAMRNYLVKVGVPAKVIVGDYAGFDTYDSCGRAKRIFGVNAMTIVTQSYHLTRALAICRTIGIDAWGVGDDSVKKLNPDTWNAGVTREYGANVKMAWDLLTQRTPTLGPPEDGVTKALAG